MTSGSPSPNPRPVKARAAHFTALAPKPFEATVGRLLVKMDTGSLQVFGNALDKSPAWVSRMKDPGDPTHIRSSEVAKTCQAVASVEPVNELFVGVRINGFEWRMQPVPEVAESEDLRLDSMEMAGAAGAYIATLGRALADGDLDRQERAELADKLAELEEQVAALRAGLRERGAA